MTDYYITFRSVTKAQTGERVLRKEGIRCALLRTPKKLSVKGCGYALKVRSGEVRAAATALNVWQVEYGKIYRVGADGSVEEAAR